MALSQAELADDWIHGFVPYGSGRVPWIQHKRKQPISVFADHTPQSLGRKLTILRERSVRIREVEGSNPFESTIKITTP